VYYLLGRIEHVVQHDIARSGSRDEGLGSKENISITTKIVLTREKTYGATGAATWTGES